MLIEIKHRYNNSVLFSHDAEEDSLKITLLTALKANANLGGANLGGADLYGTNLYGKKLIGERPYFQIGPIGSRNDYLQSFITDHGIQLKATYFSGSIEEFELALNVGHGANNHGEEYRAALALIRKHAELWTPKIEEVKAA
jgi:hypothetical protein